MDSEARPIREEIVLLAATLADTQERLQKVAARLEEDDETKWESRYEELRVAQTEAVNSAKWLRAQNIELKQKVAKHKPEMDRALSAREAAFRKLKHARKVIRDLLAERADMLSPSGSLTQEDIDRALGDEFQNDTDSNSSDSGDTVRLGAKSVAGHSPLTATSSPRPSPGPSSRMTVQKSPSVQSTSSWAGTFSPTRSSTYVSPTPTHASRSIQLSTQALSRHPSPAGSKAFPETWNIQFKKPPGSSVVNEGPFSWTDLQSLLKLGDDVMTSLHSHALSPELGMRVQIASTWIAQLQKKVTIACLYDPIFVEYQGKSCIFDWARQTTNENINKYITNCKETDSVFHTFTFPTTENNWFYLGALQWTPCQLNEVWPLKGKSSRAKILQKLSSRTRGAVNEAEILKRLDNRDLVQFCVELSQVGINNPKVTHDFAAQVLGRRTSAYTAEPRHERRPEGVKE